MRISHIRNFSGLPTSTINLGFLIILQFLFVKFYTIFICVAVQVSAKPCTHLATLVKIPIETH